MQYDDNYWMRRALNLAKKAEDEAEVPVGAIVVQDNKIIGEGFNLSISNCDPTAHAEIMAIRDACKKKNNYRLPDATLYVTLEPCPMCAGAIIHSRLAKVIYGARDIKSGALGGFMDLNEHKWNHNIASTAGILEEECSSILKEFFKARR